MLKVNDLCVRYGTGTTIGPVSWDFGKGVHHLHGPNGCGKTTLLRAVAADIHPSAGTVLLDGEDLHAVPQVRRRIGYLPAVPDLPGHLTVDEAWQTVAAMRGAPDWNGASLRETLLLPSDLLLAHGSSGQRRRAALLAALAGDPLLLLFDEPFVHLDVPGQAMLTAWLDEMRDQRVVLLTHHGELPTAPTSTTEIAAV